MTADQTGEYQPFRHVGYLCVQGYPNRICSGCTSACSERVSVGDLGLVEVGWVTSLGDDGTFYPLSGEGEKWWRFDGDVPVYTAYSGSSGQQP